MYHRLIETITYDLKIIFFPDKVCMSNPMNDLISRLILFVSYMSEEDLKKYPSRKNEEPELKDQETSITSGQ